MSRATVCRSATQYYKIIARIVLTILLDLIDINIILPQLKINLFWAAVII